MKVLDKVRRAIPEAAAKVLAHAGSLLLGLVLAVLLHYVLYRLGLPSKPFIYVAF
jgi:mannose/fructose/N-acetylgalactosamine-specific phosphotransferase system component IIC